MAPAQTDSAIADTPWRRWDDHVDTLAATIGLRLGHPVPPEVAAHARLILLDTLGCAIAGRTAPEVIALERQAAALEPGAFRFPGGCALGLRPAMQVLAIGPTWHEACEGHAFAHGRPGIATIAALLPLALARQASLGELIGAFALGYETGARAGGWLRVAPGLHVDGNWPALGVAAGVASLLGMDQPRTMRAVNIAACQLPYSLYLPIRTGRSVRNGYLAHSATLGLDAALASQAGFDAPPDALACYAENYCRAAVEPMPAAHAHLLLDAYLKPFAAVRHVHYGAIAARRIRERIAGDTRGIRRIVLSVYEEATVYCANPQPATLLAAQFSLSFGVAAMLHTGELDARGYEPSTFNDPELRRLEALVEVVVDAGLTRDNRRGARLTVEGDGMDTLTEAVAADDPALLLPVEGIREKFMRNVAAAAADDAKHAFCDAILQGEAEVSLSEVWGLLEKP